MDAAPIGSLVPETLGGLGILSWVDPATLGQNLYLLIGGCVCSLVGFVALIGLWTLLKILLWRVEKVHGDHGRRQAGLGPDGQPHPPVSRGICQRCGRAGEVYHLPTGSRLCPDCHEKPPPDPSSGV